ncbi:MAG: glycosyltransferase [Gammaproteobacteria bacterium]|nr:MAG: glycosyltransferase [Gammaproteobacteria bacterium]
MSQPALSIVIPVYNGADSIPVLVDALSQLAIDGGKEIILINDCSPDHSLSVCQQLCQQHDTPITVINLSRNFGEHNAVMAGLSQARGKYIITMDDDLQNPPEEITKLWQHARDGNFDVVYSRYSRKEHASWRNWGSRLANACADILIDKPKGLYLSSFRCMSAFAAKSILNHTGPFPYVDGLLMQVTQNIDSIEVTHLPRAQGQSNYTLKRLLRLFLSMFLNFSVMPLHLATMLGLGMAALGVVGIIVVIIEAITIGTGATGWASLMAAMLLIAGVQLTMLGVIGEYLGRLFLTINGKPQFVIRDITRNQAEPGGE